MLVLSLGLNSTANTASLVLYKYNNTRKQLLCTILMFGTSRPITEFKNYNNWGVGSNISPPVQHQTADRQALLFNSQVPNKIKFNLSFFPCHQAQAHEVWTLVYRDHVHRKSRKYRSIISTQKAPFMTACCKEAYGVLQCCREGRGYNYIVPVGWTPMFIQCGWVLDCAFTSCFPILNQIVLKNRILEKAHQTLLEMILKVKTPACSFTRTYKRTNSLYKIFTLLPWHPGWNVWRFGIKILNLQWLFFYLTTPNWVRGLSAYLFLFLQMCIDQSTLD